MNKKVLVIGMARASVSMWFAFKPTFDGNMFKIHLYKRQEMLIREKVMMITKEYERSYSSSNHMNLCFIRLMNEKY